MAFFTCLALTFGCAGWVANVDALVLSFSPQKMADSLNEVVHPMNRDIRYDKWLDPQKVLYRFDNAYSSEEKSMILKAMERISEDMHQCINFKEYNPDADAGWDNIYVSKTLNDGSVPPTCFSFYGRLLRAAGQGQKMAIHAGPTGCMASQREVMKILVNVLGLRNEYNRPDRDSFIKVYPENLQPGLRNSNLLSAYNASQVDTAGRTFDFNSVTIPVQTKYAMENTNIFDLPANKTIPLLDRLSLDDCLGLSMMYGCDASKCVDAYQVAQPSAELEKLDVNKILIELNTTPAPPVESSTNSTLASSSSIAPENSTMQIQLSESSSSPVPPSSSAPLILSSESSSLSSTLSSDSTSIPLSNATDSTTVSPHMPESIAFTVPSKDDTPATPATLLLTLATAAPLNMTLNDVIIPRKGADFPDQHNDLNATEIPMVINTETPLSSATASSAVLNSTEQMVAANQSEILNITVVPAVVVSVVDMNATVSSVPTESSSVIAVINSGADGVVAIISEPAVSVGLLSGATAADTMAKSGLDMVAVAGTTVIPISDVVVAENVTGGSTTGHM